MEAKTMEEILKALEGQVVTVVNPESYVRTLTGYKIDMETYPAKIVSYKDGTVKILTEFVRDPHKKEKDKIFQFIRIEQIKRVGVGKAERFIFL
jgi:hypothetical protein